MNEHLKIKEMVEGTREFVFFFLSFFFTHIQRSFDFYFIYLHFLLKMSYCESKGRCLSFTSKCCKQKIISAISAFLMKTKTFLDDQKVITQLLGAGRMQKFNWNRIFRQQIQKNSNRASWRFLSNAEWTWTCSNISSYIDIYIYTVCNVRTDDSHQNDFHMQLKSWIFSRP